MSRLMALLPMSVKFYHNGPGDKSMACEDITESGVGLGGSESACL